MTKDNETQNIQKLALKLAEKSHNNESINETKELKQLLDIIYPKLRNYIRKYNSNSHDIEEILHQCLYKIFKNFNTYNSEYKFTTWIYNIARNVSMAYQNRVKLNFLDIQDDATKSYISNETLQTQNDFERTMESQKEINDLYGIVIDQVLLMEDCPEKDAFIDSFINGRTNKSIAEEQEVKLNTIKTRIRRARKIIKNNIYHSHPHVKERIKEILNT